MAKLKKLSYELLGAHTDSAGKYFPRGSVLTLSQEEAKEACFENKLKRIIDDSEASEILSKATEQAEKQADKIIAEAEKKAEAIVKKAGSLVSKSKQGKAKEESKEESKEAE